jgi:tetratricopeptide (TPR) repeat protein
MRRLSDRAYVENPEASLGLTRRMCELDPGWCGRLGGDCVNLGDEAGAVVAYERMIEEAADRVMVSNNCAWLVKHYLRDGRRARAKEIAEMAAEVGSAEGLLTMAGFLEEPGRYEEAEGLIRRVRERYPEDGPDFVLFGFHHRMVHVRRLPSYERSLAQETRDLFPRGLEMVTLASLTGPPIDGATFTEETPSLRRNGMQKGDVVVALDGWRVRTLQQYYAIRSFDDDPDLRLIIWRDGKYAEVAARRMYRSFGAEMSDYPPRHERSPGSAPAAAK